MYLTLAAQYESFRDPAVMLISVPMSLAGALLFFAVGVVNVNIYTQIGLLALIGSIIRHGAASRFAISFTLGVGMAIGTLFTLFVVPALYTVVASDRGAINY